MTPQARPLEVPGAGSPLTRTTLTGPSREAVVLASFPMALYLGVGKHHEVLPVLASDALKLPTGVRLSTPGHAVHWGVEPGETVAVGRSAIQLPDWQVRVVREWRPARVHPLPTLADPARLSEIADLLTRELATPELMDQASAVCRAARSADSAQLRRWTRRLLGAGQGLTPSGDDVLCAVLLVLNGIGGDAPTARLAADVTDLWRRTTSLSASLLFAASHGYAVPEIVALVDACLRGDLVAVHEALTPTLAIGHSSGHDLVAGLAGSLRVLADTPIAHTPSVHRPPAQSAAPYTPSATTTANERTRQPAGRANP